MKNISDQQRKLLFGSFLLSAFFMVVIMALVAVALVANKERIFNYLAANYFAELQKEHTAGTTSETSVKHLFTDQSLIIGAVKKANPAVVSIVITKDIPVLEQYYESIDPWSDFFGGGDLFGSPFQFQVPRIREKGTEKKEVGGGSGFLVSYDGLIVTNRHVVEDGDAEYAVFTNDGEKHGVTVLARDGVLDIAVLKITASTSSYPYLEFGDSDRVEVGQTAIAIGNALGEFRNTVSVGVISGLSRSITAGDQSGKTEFLDQVIQTDAAINPGNSGGPLLDLNGNVIGVNVAVVLGSQNIGFALPANAVRSVVSSVKEHGRIIRPFLGIRYIQVTPELKEANKLPVDYGILVARGSSERELAVVPGSPADKAGIFENDIILEFDGVKLAPERNFAALIRAKNVGDPVDLLVLHKGEKKSVRAILGEMPE